MASAPAQPRGVIFDGFDLVAGLSGELPQREDGSAEQRNCPLAVAREGWSMQRRPGLPPGLGPGSEPPEVPCPA